MTETMRRITRSPRDRVFGGVCGGIAQYVGWDPVLVRILYVVLTLLSNGAGILVYLLAWIIIPLKESADTASPVPARTSDSSRTTLGFVVIIVGALALIGSFLPMFYTVSDWRLLGPLALIALGLALVLNRGNRRDHTTASPYAEGGIAKEPEQSKSEFRRRLVRVERGKKIAGVCAGLGEYFDIDPTLVRLLWVALVLIAGTGVLLYLIMWMVMPLEKVE